MIHTGTICLIRCLSSCCLFDRRHLLSWIPSIWLAKYLSRPLVTLEKHVKQISKQDWDDPVIVDREDEIGKLGHTIEDMRQSSSRKMRQNARSCKHLPRPETPVMVIRGYTQSIKDGIYPKGDLENTIEVIEGEAENLKEIKDLLYLTKLDYLLRQERQYGTLIYKRSLKKLLNA
ncbi:HAMP domain-containing protein [Bacillus licheniformis]|nr:HAMP domain-containing protein [Bacillus licheniformis]